MEYDRATNVTAGPGDYNAEFFTGNTDIKISKVKAAPAFSFSKSLTHRIIESIKSDGNLSARPIRNDPGDVHVGSAANYSSGSMLFYRTGGQPNPGVGDYLIDKIALGVKNRSPIAIIGKESRFNE